MMNFQIFFFDAHMHSIHITINLTAYNTDLEAFPIVLGAILSVAIGWSFDSFHNF